MALIAAEHLLKYAYVMKTRLKPGVAEGWPGTDGEASSGTHHTGSRRDL